MKIDYNTKLVTVYTGKAWEAMLVRHLLNKDGITAWMINKDPKNKAQKNELPHAWYIVKVKVSNMDYIKAKTIVDKYKKKSRKQISAI